MSSGNSAPGFGKDPLMPSHGDSLPDQSFQSLKTKEVRDSTSPTHDIKFHAMALNQPNTTGWDVRSSSEVSPDGRAFRSDTIATTDGTEKINGGVSEFKGRNEQHSSASRQGDDKNFTKKASESANTHLQEKVVIGDENSGRTQIKKSSTSTSSSSQVISSSSTTGAGAIGEPISDLQNSRYLTDSSVQQQHKINQQRLHEEQYRHEQQQQQKHQQLRQQHEDQRQTISQQHQHQQNQYQQTQQRTEEYNKNRQESTRNVETEKLYEENKHYVDMDKASPEYQRHVQQLMAQPGEIISNTVEYPKPNVKMITTVKRLPDGTIVKNKRYETEESHPSTENIQHRSTTTSTSKVANQQRSNQQRIEEENLQTRLRNSREKNTTTQVKRQISPQHPDVETVDNVQRTQQQVIQSRPGHQDEEVTNSSSFSSVKKSSRRFSTETTSETSETVEEHDDRTKTHHHGLGKPQDFSTHGFPSVKPNKPTQEYPSDRPRAVQPTKDFSTQGFPSVKSHKPTQEYPSERPSPVRSTMLEQVIEDKVMDTRSLVPTSPNQRTIQNTEGEVIVVSKQSQQSFKQKSSAERVVETEIISGSQSHPRKSVEDFTTHGFPSVKESSPVWDDAPHHSHPTVSSPHGGSPVVKSPQHGTPKSEHPKSDFTTHGFPSVKETSPVWDDQTTQRSHVSELNTTRTVKKPTEIDESVVSVSSETKRTVNQKTNAERVVEVVSGSKQAHHEYNSTEHHTEDFTTHGFPSVKHNAPTRDITPQHYTIVREPERERSISPRRPHASEDFSTHGFPSARSPTRTKPDHSTKGFPSSRSPTRTKPSDYSTHGFPSARDETKPKPRPSQSPQRRGPSSTSTPAATKKVTTRTTSGTDSSRTVRKEKEVDATHRRFAASLRSSNDSQTDHPHQHQRLTPRSSVSSHTTNTRPHRVHSGREGSHDSAAQSETSRFSSSTVTRQSPAKSVGKTVVTTKQTSAKTRNAIGSNDKLDLTPQRSNTKSPSPGKVLTTTTKTTTTTMTTAAKQPGGNKTTPAGTTKTVTTVTTTKTPNAEVPKPSAKSSTYSPTAPSSHKTHRTSEHHVVKKDSPEREYQPKNNQQHSDIDDINEPFPSLSTSEIEPVERYPQTKYPKEKTNSVEQQRRTVLRETTFEKQQVEPIYDSDEPSIASDFEPYERTDSQRSVKPKQLYPDEELTPTPIRKYPKKDETTRVEQLFNVTQHNVRTNKTSSDVNNEFIKTERKQSKDIDESTDGGLISKGKSPEPVKETPTSPSFRKKGLTRRETFEERCRQILGMEDNGDTQGQYNKRDDTTEIDTNEKDSRFYVKIEDCVDDDDDENYIKETVTIQKNKIDKNPVSNSYKTEKIQIEENEDLAKTSTEKVFPKRSSPEPREKDQPTPKSDGPKPSKCSPERSRSPQKTDLPRKSPERYESPVSHQANYKKTYQNVEIEFEIVPKSKSPTSIRKQQSPTSISKNPRPSNERKSPSPVRRNQSPSPTRKIPNPSTTRVSKSPSPTRGGPTSSPRPVRKNETPRPRHASKSPSPVRKSPSPSLSPLRSSPSPTRPYKNEQTTIKVTTTTNHRSKSKSPSPSRKFAPKSDRPIVIDSDLETESPLESDVDTVRERYITEKVIDSKNKTRFEKTVQIPKSTGPKPKSTPTSTTTTRKPSLPKTTDQNQPSRKTPSTTRKSIDTTNTTDDIQTKTARTSSITASNTSVKTTAKHHMTSQHDVQTAKQAPSPSKYQPKQPSRTNDSVEQIKTTTTKSTANIKDRLRSSTRSPTKKNKDDEQDGSLPSSPDFSPTRATERRRSSNIAVHTEIIIDHAGSKSPEREVPTKKTPQPFNKKPVKDSPDTVVTRKQLVTERKESAPVNRVTRRDDDIKMSRSVSENIMKVNGHAKPVTKKPAEPSTLSPKSDRRHPNKCFTTKTINLTTSNKLMNSQEMQNVVIDIQHAKSSREPSPDKIVPTPVPADLDTGKPRYPDVVQEPEDEPRRRPVVKNIPILEEDTNSFIGCHISEVNVKKSTTIDNTDYNDEILTQPTIEAPKSLEYPSIDKPDDECLLSVHEKVTKFAHTAEEVKKPKASSPFSRVYEKSPLVPEDDECLLTVDEKVNKFLKTAESITKAPVSQSREIERPNLEDLDDELRQDECTLSVSEKVNKFKTTAEKITSSTTQKSPEMVARIERHFSRQSEPDDDDQDEEPIPFSENHTIVLEAKRQKDILSRPSVWDRNGSRPKFEREPETDKDELVPMSKTHTTDIELRRQKDILSRPSVFEDKKSPSLKPIAQTTTKKSTIQDKLQRFETTSHHRITIENNEDQEPKKVIKSTRPLIPSTSVSKTRTHFELEKLKKETDQQSRTNKQTKPIVNGKRPETSPLKNKPNTDSFTDETESDREFIENEESILRKSSTTSAKVTRSPTKTPKIPHEVSHSPTRRSSSPNKNATASTTTTITRVVERTSKTHPTSETTTQETVLNASILESPRKTPSATQPTQPRKPTITNDTVAARRNIFEKSTESPISPKVDTRRPSYMDHTRSSLEHIRRDSLEVNKTHYSRKPSTEDDNQYPVRPNSLVKFDVPQRDHPEETSSSEYINIEEIFDLEVLEEMLETVTSYDLRRRIRAQIRIVKKNALNTSTTTSQTDSKMTTSSTTQKSSKYSSNKTHSTDHHEEIEHVRKLSPSNRTHSPREGPKKPHDTIEDREIPRDHIPKAKTISSSLKEVRRVSEQVDSVVEHEARHTPSRQDRSTSPVSKPPIKPRERSISPETKPRTTSTTPYDRVSPTPKPRERSQSPQEKRSIVHEERRTVVTKTTSRGTHSPERKSSKPKIDDKTPIWADRKNILRKPSSQSPTTTRKTSSTSSTTASRSASAKLTQKSTSSSQRQRVEEDSITSSYGIGPTDENGLPLFGIRALKKKNSTINTVKPCEDTEEVTGYVIEEQWYSDGTKVPKHERKEFIYSTNEKELKSMKKQVESRKSSKDDVNVTRKFQKIDKDYIKKEPEAILPSTDIDGFSTSKQHVRRGSVKEMSEKFIRKESTQSVNEQATSKSNNYPKAGLIYRTNSRKGSTGTDDGNNAMKATTTTTTTHVRSKHRPQHYDDNDYDYDYDVDNDNDNVYHDEQNYESTHAQERYEQKKHHQTSTRSFHESESESSEAMSAKREFVSKKASSSVSSSTRSFLNSSGETRVITDVDDVLERMRNADNVVEEGDTPEDQEARALLNKFLGASVIMRGVETGNITGSPQGKQETKTTTSTSYDDGGKITTTRVTKTIKSSGSSSTPVTYSTCDIEEIWDEEILKELLERATTYEERRKIRARLRELMAEREAQQSLQQQREQHGTSSTSEKTETKEKDGATVTTTTKVTTRTVTAGNASKQISPFNKFKQLDRQNSLPSQKCSSTPSTPNTPGSGSIFKFTDPSLNAKAATMKDQLLQWCQLKTKDYENVQISNFSSSWSDGLAFCALIHHFLPDAFDYSKLTPQSRRHNFELAFRVADEKAGIAPLLDVEDMVIMKRPDWKSVFVYVQSIYRRFRNCQ